MRERLAGVVFVVVALLALVRADSSHGVVGTELVSVGPGDQPLERMAGQYFVSEDGRFVAFNSLSPDMSFESGPHYCSPDYSENGPPCNQIYVRDRLNMTTERIVPGIGGEAPDATVWLQDMTPDSRYLALTSEATNLDPNDDPDPPNFFASRDVFLFDRQTGTSEKVNLASDGSQTARYAYDARVSSNARYVAFITLSHVDPRDTDDSFDVYVRDRQAEKTTWASGPTVSPSQFGGNLLDVTDDGLVFLGGSADDYGLPTADTVPNMLVRNVGTGDVSMLPIATPHDVLQSFESASISSDGHFVTFVATTNSPGVPRHQMFLYDRQTQALEIVGKSTSGEAADVGSPSNPLWLQSGDVSDDGRYVVFTSGATNLAPPDNNNCVDVFVRDRQLNQTMRANVAFSGMESQYSTADAAISGDGSTIVFSSYARDLIAGHHNGVYDLYAVTTSALPTNIQPVGADSYCGARPGDANCDGAYTANDVVNVLRYIALTPPYSDCIYMANVTNCFTSYTPIDALRILTRVLDSSITVGCNGK